MKKFSLVLTIMLSAFLLLSCDKSGAEPVIPEGKATMNGIVNDIGDNIIITVTDDLYKDQTMIVLVNGDTPYYFADGKKADKSSVKIGDAIEVSFSGQVMLSLPGQISAIKIVIK